MHKTWQVQPVNLQKYSSWWRGAPATGVGRVTGARVRVSPSAPKKRYRFRCLFFDAKNRESNKAIRRIVTVLWTVTVPACVPKKALAFNGRVSPSAPKKEVSFLILPFLMRRTESRTRQFRQKKFRVWMNFFKIHIKHYIPFSSPQKVDTFCGNFWFCTMVWTKLMIKCSTTR